MTKGRLHRPLATTELFYITLGQVHRVNEVPPVRTAPQGALQERLHEFVGRAEKVRPAARVDIARIVARLEVVLAACVSVGRFRVQQVPDAECDPQILVDQPGVRTEEMEDAVRLDGRMLLRARVSWTSGIEILSGPR